MANKEIKTLNLNGNTYEIVDEAARASLSSHTHSTLNSSDGTELLYCYSNDGYTRTYFRTKANNGDYSYCSFGNNTFYTGEGSRVYAENYKPALTDLSGTLAIAHGGTGATTAAAACANIGAVKKSGDTMTGGLTTTGLTIKSSNLYPGISLRASEQDEPSASIASNASTRRIYFTNYCSDSDYKELFFTPTPTTGRTSDASYHLLTSKNAVTIGQGGTGATTASQARHNIGADHAYNLLVNSNFADPVNRQGKTSYSGGEDAIDRWKMQLGTNMILMDGFIRITGDWDARQFLGGKLIGTYTFAVYAKVNVVGEYKQTIELFENDSSIASCLCTSVGEWKIYTCTATFTGANNITNQMVIINNRAGSVSDASFDVKWAALYEGSYTADTLPAYVPYPKQVEMIRCGVSLSPQNLLDNSDFTNPVNQRGITGTVSSGYAFDRWYTYAVSGESIWWAYDTERKDMVVQNGGGNASVHNIVQTLPNSLNGKQLTYAVWDDDGSVTVLSGTVGTDTISGSNVSQFGSAKAANGNYYITLFKLASSQLCQARINVYAGKTARIKYAALYEGVYTADTLPPYVPKGYGAELAECRRYYQRVSTPGVGIFGHGYATGTGSALIILPVSRMRILAPSLNLSGDIRIKNFLGVSVSLDGATVTPYAWTDDNVWLYITGLSGLTTNNPYNLMENSSKAAYIEFNADL